jgi:hypothetical protein
MPSIGWPTIDTDCGSRATDCARVRADGNARQQTDLPVIVTEFQFSFAVGAGSIAALLSSELGPDLALVILSMFF